MNGILLAWNILSTSFVCIAWAALLGGLTGAVSMLLYAKVSPQSRLAELSAEACEARRALNRIDDGDLRLVLSLTKRAIGLSLQRMGLILGPAVLAGLVVLGAAWLADVVFHLSQHRFGPAWAPWWLCRGYAAFWMPLSVAAIGLKWTLKIK